MSDVYKLNVHKGNSFEDYVFASVLHMLNAGKLGLDPKHCKVFRKKRYESNLHNGGTIEVDISLELCRPGATTPMLIIVWECKNYSGKVGKGQVKKFFADIQEIGPCMVKGIIATTSSLSFFAEMYARSQRMGVWTFQMPEEPAPKRVAPEPSGVPLESLSPVGALFLTAAAGVMALVAAHQSSRNDYRNYY